MVREYRGIAFKRPKTWLGRLFDSTPEECYQALPRIVNILNPQAEECMGTRHVFQCDDTNECSVDQKCNCGKYEYNQYTKYPK